MTLRHMRIFVAVCDCGSITAAADSLYMAQPAVSLAVKELENYYGLKLFDRIAKRLYITEAGKRFLGYASHIVALFDEMETSVRDWDSSGVLRVGASITVGARLLPRYIKLFCESRPDMEVKVAVNSSEIIEAMLLSSELDLGVIEGVVHSPSITAKSFMDDELAVICQYPPPFPGGIIEPENLGKENVLLREHGSGTRELFDSVCEANGIAIEPCWESTSTRALISAVSNGLGISVLPRQLVLDELKAKKIALAGIRGFAFKRKLSVVYHKNKYLTPCMSEFIDVCMTADINREYDCGGEGHDIPVLLGQN